MLTAIVTCVSFGALISVLAIILHGHRQRETNVRLIELGARWPRGMATGSDDD